ncbi:MAG: ABC transporter permease [Roseburia sp.]|nr:ABC transporter permease [Roseburia sp.]MCM1241300.1 ABC transporter permease [Roseburia sp.]
MNRLLGANLARMIKSRIFWVLEIFMFGYGVFAYASMAVNIKNGLHAVGGYLPYFFNEMLAMGGVTALFTVFFLGTEYSDGVIRNKISVGHRRIDIYLANVITCYIATVIEFATYTLTAIVIGGLLIGRESFDGFNQMPQRIGCCLVILLAYAVIFSLLSMLDSSKARVTAVSLVLVLVFVILVTQIYGDLAEPELTDRMVMSPESGELELEENIPNSRYISGTKRIVYEWIDSFLPADQVMYVMEWETEMTWKAPLCMLGESVVLICLGIYVFGRKDIK